MVSSGSRFVSIGIVFLTFGLLLFVILPSSSPPPAKFHPLAENPSKQKPKPKNNENEVMMKNQQPDQQQEQQKPKPILPSLHQFYTFEGLVQGKSSIPMDDADLLQDPIALTRLGKGPHIDERPNSTALQQINRFIPNRRWTSDQPKPTQGWINPATLGFSGNRNNNNPPAGGRDEDWYEDFDPKIHPAFLKPLFFSEEEKKVRDQFIEKTAKYRRGTLEWTNAMMELMLDPKIPSIPPWRPGRARPIICEGREYYSATFSIPKENIISAPPVKTQDWGAILPGKKSTYRFKEEHLFRQDMERSFFSLTRRKFGWVTSRNLEILAAGSVPYFCGIESMPRIGTLRHLPLDALFAIKNWVTPKLASIRCQPPKHASVGALRRPDFSPEEYGIVNSKLLRYTRESLTTPLAALHILSATSLTTLPKSVLIIWSIPYSILLTGFIHGLRSLGVESVIDVPRRGDNYKGPECEAAKGKTYAKGWFFFCRTPESEGISREHIGRRIAEKEFDLVVFGISDYWTYYMIDPFEEIPYFSHVVKHYPRDRFVVINDADLLKPMTTDVAQKMMHNYTLYFRRETHTCGGFA